MLKIGNELVEHLSSPSKFSKSDLKFIIISFNNNRIQRVFMNHLTQITQFDQLDYMITSNSYHPKAKVNLSFFLLIIHFRNTFIVQF